MAQAKCQFSSALKKNCEEKNEIRLSLCDGLNIQFMQISNIHLIFEERRGKRIPLLLLKALLYDLVRVAFPFGMIILNP